MSAFLVYPPEDLEIPSKNESPPAVDHIHRLGVITLVTLRITGTYHDISLSLEENGTNKHEIRAESLAEPDEESYVKCPATITLWTAY